MIGQSLMQAERGQAYRFIWRTTHKPAATPSVVLPSPINGGAGLTRELTLLRAAAVVASVAADLRTVTLNPGVGATSKGLIGEEGAAWLDLGEGGQFPVRVATFNSSTVLQLSDALSYKPGVTTGTLTWLGYYADLTAEDIGAVTARRIPWVVRWTQYEGANHPGIMRRDSGLLDVVKCPFSTGVGHEDVLALVPLLAKMVPERQRSWESQVALAFDDLVGRLEAVLQPHSGRFVDMVDGRQFALAHAMLAAHKIMQGHRAAGYRRDEVDFKEEFDLEFASQSKRIRWIDLDGDGGGGHR